MIMNYVDGNFLGMGVSEVPRAITGMGLYVVGVRAHRLTLVRYDDDNPSDRDDALREHHATLTFLDRS